MIRISHTTIAEIASRPDFLRIAHCMFEEAYEEPYNTRSIQHTIKTLVKQDMYCVTAETDTNELVGVICFYIGTDSFFLNKVAIEHFACVLPEYRNSTVFIRMLKSFLSWVKNTMSISAITMSSINKDPEKKASYYNMLQRCGFKEKSCVYEMKL